jgi:hypothetical protein
MLLCGVCYENVEHLEGVQTNHCTPLSAWLLNWNIEVCLTVQHKATLSLSPAPRLVGVQRRGGTDPHS